jgi:predicted component of type VI protein secretion system
VLLAQLEQSKGEKYDVGADLPPELLGSNSVFSVAAITLLIARPQRLLGRTDVLQPTSSMPIEAGPKRLSISLPVISACVNSGLIVGYTTMGMLKGEPKPQFLILVLADFSGQAVHALPKLKDRRIVTVTRESYPQFMRAIQPGFFLAPGGAAQAGEKYDVRFTELDAFNQDAVIALHKPRDLADKILNSLAYHDLFSTWLGLRGLVDATAQLANVEVQVWDVTKKELLRDLQRAPEFDQSAVFKRVYEEGVGTFGGKAIGVIAADFFLSAHPEDCDLAEKISQVAAVAASPFLCGVRPGFLAARRWDDLTGRFDPRWFRDCAAFARWRELALSEDSRFLALLLPRWRARQLTGSDRTPTAQDSVWLHPSYLAAARIARAMNSLQLADIAAKLLSNWHAAEPADASNGTAAEADVELEWEGDEETRAALARIGICALSLPRIDRTEALDAAATFASFAHPAANLAFVLLKSWVWHRVYGHARRVKRLDSAAELIQNVDRWAGGAIPIDSAGQALLTLGEMEHGTTRVPISWHPAAGGGSEHLSLPRLGVSVQLPPKKDVPRRPRSKIVVMADLEPPERDTAEYGARQWSPGDDYVPFAGGVTLTVPDRVNSGAPIEVRLSGQNWEDFEPESLQGLTPGLKDSADCRATLISVGFYAHIDPRRSCSLAEFGSRPETLAALMSRVEGWRSLLRDPEHGAIDAETVEATLAGWGFEEDLYDKSLEHSLFAFQQYLSRTGMSSGLNSVEQLRQHVEDIDRLVWQQVLEVYRAPGFRNYERACLAVKWLAGSVHDLGTVLAFRYQQRIWAKAFRKEKFRQILADLWNHESDDEWVVMVGTRFYPELLDVAEEVEGFATLPRAARRVMIVPLDSALPPLAVEDLEPSLAAAVLRPKTITLILAVGDFLVQPARRLKGWPERGFDPCIGEVIEEDLCASSAYQVAAAVVETAQWRSRCDSTTLEPALNRFGLTCRPLGEAIVVMRQAENADAL